MKVLFVNSKIFECGVYQYGKRICSILNTETRYETSVLETDNVQEFNLRVADYKPDVIIYNWHISTMCWLTPQKTQELFHLKQLFISHEGSLPTHLYNNGYLAADMSYSEQYRIYPLIRPIFSTNLKKEKNDIPIIGSFGFGFDNKGFDKICSLVSSAFETAVIKLHITNPFFGDYSGNTANNIIQRCKSQITNPYVTLEVATDFLTDEGILNFLNSNSLNIFLYDDMNGRGLSSVIDYAVSVDTPLAVNNSYMFRHIINDTPNISICNTSLQQIIDNGIDDVLYYRNKWNHNAFKDNLFNILFQL